MSSPDVILNGRVVNGRTHQNSDGSYESLDLAKVKPGDEVIIITEQGSHTLVKGDDTEHAAALEGWARLRGEAALGVTTLVLLECHKSGARFLTQRVVLRRGLEVGALDELAEEPNVIRGLGVVASIAYRPVESTATTVVEELVSDTI